MVDNLLKIAIAIPTYNRDEILIDTLLNVFSQDLLPDEVLVIDQSNEHRFEVQSKLDSWHKEGRIKYLRQPNPSLPAARNCALRETRCDVVIFIDDDVVLDPVFVASHRSTYIVNADAVAVAGRVVQRNGWPEVKRPLHWPRVMDYRYFKLDGQTRVDGVANFVGCNHSVRVGYARVLGGYDEEYRGVALREETDFALRIYNSGGLIIFAPEASLYHLAAPSGGCRKKSVLDVSGAVSVFRFAWKFHRILGVGQTLREMWHALRIGLLTKLVMRRPYMFPIVFAKLCSQCLAVVFSRRIASTDVTA